MVMKKVLSVVLVTMMILSGMPVLAEEASRMQEVLLNIKERIMDTDDFKEFNSSVMESNGDKIYSFDWNTNVDDSYKSLSVTANDNGLILNYRYYDDVTNSYNSAPSLNKLSLDEAMIKAQKLIDTLNPEISGKIRVEKTGTTESLFDSTYRFNLQRYENDIPVYNDNGFVTVNGDATKITRYSLNYTDGILFDGLDDIVSVSDAWKYYYENAGAELEYRLRFKDKEKEIYLSYIPLLGSEEYIDAKTGEVTPVWHRDYHYFTENYAMGTMNKDMAVEESARLSEIELEKIQEVAGLKSAEDAQIAIKNNDILDFCEDLVLTSINLYKDYNGDRYFYDITFESQMSDVYKYASATLDAKTLEIIRWRAHLDDYIEYHKGDGEKEIDKKDIEEKAFFALKVIAPKYFGENSEYKITDIKSNQLSFIRYVNDIKFGDDRVNIEINPENGKVWSYSINYTDVEFPLPEGIITEEEAIEKMSQKASMTLYYFLMSKTEKGLKADNAVLGYKNGYISEIDAFSGAIEDFSAESSKMTYSDIENHYAKKEIETLARFGIGFEGSEFKPDDVITVNEYITLLMSTFSHYTPVILKASNDVTYEYKEAVKNGIVDIKKVNPDKPLTRESAAIYMIRVMGLEEVAKLDSIYKPVFQDVTQNVGYISILGAMGVFKGDENSLFNPNKNLTRADSLILIYNYLSR